MLDSGGEEGTSHRVPLTELQVLDGGEGEEGHHLESSQQGTGR